MKISNAANSFFEWRHKSYLCHLGVSAGLVCSHLLDLEYAHGNRSLIHLEA